MVLSDLLSGSSAALVLQQHDRLARRLERQLRDAPGCRSREYGICAYFTMRRRIEHAQLEARRRAGARRRRSISASAISPLLDGRAAGSRTRTPQFEVGARLHRRGDAGRGVGRGLVVADRCRRWRRSRRRRSPGSPTRLRRMSSSSVGLAQAGIAVDAVVGAHHRMRAAFA